MSTEKEKKNTELLQRLDNYLEETSTDQLFKDLEGRYPEGPSLEDIFGQSET